MCGIVGVSGQLDLGLGEAVKILRHRGPDNSDIFVDQDGGVALGHTRLAILDLSPAGHQPMFNPDKTVSIVFNGEIYNFKDLRRELTLSGYTFRGGSDTEVLLTMYLEFGEEMLSKLNGVFSFAIWDRRIETLLVARDALGVKPLYYVAGETGFIFASEIKALIPLIPNQRELDTVAIHRYLGFLWCPGEKTPISSVKKLQPGEALKVRRGRISDRWSWYTLPGFSASAKVKAPNKIWIQQTASLLRKAVHRQMVSDVPTGAFLSGGLDSSAVVAFARELNPDLRCFTIDIDGGQEPGTTDDLPFAKKVAKHLGVPLDTVPISSGAMAGDLERMVMQLDEPLADPASLNVLYISQLARENGIKVLLSGAGGDDLFTGYRRHRAISAARLWQWMPTLLLKGAEKFSGGLDQRSAMGRKIAKLLGGASLQGDEAIAYYFLWAKEADLFQIYSEETKRELLSQSLTQPLEDFLKKTPRDLPNLEKMLLLEQRFFLADHNLTYTDKMSMAAGVEARVPFLDLELVKFAASIPIELKQRGGHGKWILKKAMEPYLPADVIYRPKTGFGAPVRRWMRGELRELLTDTLSRDRIIRRGIFDPRGVEQMIKENDSGLRDSSYTLFSLLCMEIWFQKFSD